MSGARNIAAFVTCCAVTFAHPAAAWDGAVTGKIIGIDAVSDAENYGFRMYLDQPGAMCAGGQAWAYINKSATNYEVVVSLVTTAWMAGKPVTLYTTTVGPYCQIGYVTARN